MVCNGITKKEDSECELKKPTEVWPELVHRVVSVSK